MDDLGEIAQMDYDEDLRCPVCFLLLVDPTTLNCGHTMCKLCLARWYNVSKKKECTVCRQQWEGQPKVNTTIRNIINKMHYRQLVMREKDLQQDPENAAHLQKFDKCLNTMMTAQPKKPDVPSFFIGILFTLVVVMIIYLFNYWHTFGDRDQLVNKPVAFWRTSDVVKWLNSMQWASNYSQNAQILGIDGHMLLDGDELKLLKLLNVTDVVHQNVFQITIHSLRSTGVKMPSTLWEYKALYPGRSLFLVYALKEFPRSTMLLNYFFYYEESFLPFMYTTTSTNGRDFLTFLEKLPDPTIFQLLSFWVFMLAMPYYMLGLFAWHMRSVHTYTPWFLMTSCALLMLLDGTFYSELVFQQRWRNWSRYLKLHIKEMLTSVIFMIFWPLAPSFICDLLFYGALYLTPLSLVKSVWQRIRG